MAAVYSTDTVAVAVVVERRRRRLLAPIVAVTSVVPPSNGFCASRLSNKAFSMSDSADATAEESVKSIAARGTSNETSIVGVATVALPDTAEPNPLSANADVRSASHCLSRSGSNMFMF